MLDWAGTFLAIALIAASFAVGDVGSVSGGAAQVVSLVFAGLFVAALIAFLMR